MKKLTLLFSLMMAAYTYAQIGGRFPSTKIGNEESKWTFGGYAGLGGAFGSNFSGTAIYIMPRVGYLATENFEIGLAGNLTWQNSKYYSSTMLGIGPYANYYFDRSFFLSGIYQHYFISQKNKNTDYKISVDEATLYLGGGYMQRIGEKTYIQIGAMYNVLYKKNQSFFGGGFLPNVGIVYGL